MDPKYTRSDKERGNIDPIYKEFKKANLNPMLEDLFKRGRACARESMTKQLQDTHLSVVVPPNRTQRSQSSSPLVVRTSIPPTFDALLLIGATLLVSIIFRTN